jgi:hypothetical protein
MTYSTQQLLDILDQELRATWKGKRILLSSAERLDNPVVAKALDMQKVGKVFAYQDFRRQVHEYQQEYQVSGLIWRDCHFQGRSVRFPELHNQLIAVAGDKERLMAAKTEILEFWQICTQGMGFWLAAHHHRPLRPDSLADFIQETEWAELDATQSELFLGLCWGNPQDYQYDWAKPESGYHRIVAAMNQPSAIKV